VTRGSYQPGSSFPPSSCHFERVLLPLQQVSFPDFFFSYLVQCPPPRTTAPSDPPSPGAALSPSVVPPRTGGLFLVPPSNARLETAPVRSFLSYETSGCFFVWVYCSLSVTARGVFSLVRLLPLLLAEWRPLCSLGLPPPGLFRDCFFGRIQGFHAVNLLLASSGLCLVLNVDRPLLTSDNDLFFPPQLFFENFEPSPFSLCFAEAFL